MSAGRVRAVVFDLGHTIWDYAPRDDSRRLNVLRLYRRLVDAFGDAPEPAALDRALGEVILRWVERWRSGQLEQPPGEALVREALASLGVNAPDALSRELAAIIFGAELDFPVVAPDSLWAIATLHERGLALGCVTNTILLESAIRDALYRLGLLRYISSVVVSSAVGYQKPHPALFRQALDDIGIPAGEVVFVGDRLVEDVGGAQAAGMRAVLTHQFRQEQAADGSPEPDAIIRRLSELPDVIESFDP
ncbi:MAG: HAD family hydrolase [Dehalococcoidia bacterium]